MLVQQAQTGEDPARDTLDRRRMLGGALAMSGILAAPAGAQEATVPPDAAALSANLLTRMAASIRLNGRRRALFVLDTGAERTAIARDLAEALELPPGPSVIVHGVTAAQMASTVHINRLSFGGQGFNDLQAPVLDRALLAADGLLGLDVLSKFRLELDLERRSVSLTPSGSFLVRGSASWIPTRLPAGADARVTDIGQLILTNALANGMAVESFVDSGAQYSVGNLALLRATGGEAGGRPIPLYGVTGQVADALPGRVSDLRIARQVLGPTPLLFADLHAFQTLGLSGRPALLIGADILYRFRRIVLDYGRGRMGFGGLRPNYVPPSATG